MGHRSTEQTAVRHNEAASTNSILHQSNLIQQQQMTFLQGLREAQQASLLTFEKLCQCNPTRR